ncbi:phosphocholine cytidylyltransferase family protein [Pseudomonas sp. 7P_10.2_Bac1]|uniref:phosphocholine cytidylyltransferase family protein n=1 Tax=Pseudomonas sp. 7P_10.2_Bac1 TaxID=2971614 RepID=UPI0021C9BC0E|nr:phosphocholine cytidylyltransferase family protein [Pseudomonas sp. 7P_10.2_Bac1]MCU1727291.1 phosphocholine cytidylyltransferase family protein [Pseudomonas sp. 7P_10.2_Bac1]
MQDLRGMAAIILAAGIGRRLHGWEGPKGLIQFGGKTLLARHLQTLRELGITDIFVTAGHQAEAIRAELQTLDDQATVVVNERFSLGSAISVLVHESLLRSGRPIVLMDADVLYAEDILTRLIQSAHESALLVDMHEVDDEAVKVCFKAGQIVDFEKRPEHPYETCGESVGFFKFSPAAAAALADLCERHIAEHGPKIEYEAPLRELILENPAQFGVEVVTGLPWVEIDFDHDVIRAREQVLPHL